MSALAMLGVTTFLSIASVSLPAPAQQVQAEPVAITETQEDMQKERLYDDARQEKILAQWEEKQRDKWSSLPAESFTINASAYTAAADECGKSDGITASGVKVEEKRTLACPPTYPFGAKIEIDGHGVFVCEDRGGAIKGNKFDIYMETKKEAFAFGRQQLTARVVE
ncbi:MAG TPA: 3D domain-containing protein [Patescibacteria group bacterium]|nr:3D domain-containing protein [Patescibacteria group bacterium]